MNKLAIVFTLLLCGCSVAACGCFSFDSPSVVGTNDRTITWSSNGADSVPGVDYASLLFNSYDQGDSGRTLIVIWTTFDPRIGFASGSSAGTDKQNHTAYVEKGTIHNSGAANAELTKIEYQIMLNGEGSGTVEIAKDRFDIAKGSIFLVAFNNGEMTLKQLKRDMSQFPSEAVDFQALAASDNEIHEFFAGNAPPVETYDEQGMKASP